MAVSPASARAEHSRVIKKYPNRRLYDTATSAYITLAEVRQRVMDGDEFVVQDAKTGEDLTRSILLQIILEEEANGSPMFTTPVLAAMIRFYGNAMQGFMGGYLEKTMQTMAQLQANLGTQAKTVTPEMWTQLLALQPQALQNLLGANLEQSRTLMSQMQEHLQQQAGQFLGAFGIKR